MKPSQWRVIVTLLVVMSQLWTSGCTSMQTVQMPGRAQVPAVATGEYVSVTRIDGQKLEFKVTAVEPDALAGEKVRVPYRDIAKLEVRRHDRNETGTVVAIVSGALVIALGYALAHVAAPMPGP
jgi:hypothetical protein